MNSQDLNSLLSNSKNYDLPISTFALLRDQKKRKDEICSQSCCLPQNKKMIPSCIDRLYYFSISLLSQAQAPLFC